MVITEEVLAVDLTTKIQEAKDPSVEPMPTGEGRPIDEGIRGHEVRVGDAVG